MEEEEDEEAKEEEKEDEVRIFFLSLEFGVGGIY